MSVKSDLFDMVSDFREKWDSDESLRRKYDLLVRDMVLGTNFSPESSSILILDSMAKLINLFIAITRENLDFQKDLQER